MASKEDNPYLAKHYVVSYVDGKYIVRPGCIESTHACSGEYVIKENCYEQYHEFKPKVFIQYRITENNQFSALNEIINYYFENVVLERINNTSISYSVSSLGMMKIISEMALKTLNSLSPLICPACANLANSTADLITHRRMCMRLWAKDDDDDELAKKLHEYQSRNLTTPLFLINKAKGIVYTFNNSRYDVGPSECLTIEGCIDHLPKMNSEKPVKIIEGKRYVIAGQKELVPLKGIMWKYDSKIEN